MLWTIFVILLVLWLVGLVSFHAIGAYIHILLVLALVVSADPVDWRQATGSLGRTVRRASIGAIVEPSQ